MAHQKKEDMEYWYVSIPNDKDQTKALKILSDCIKSRQGAHWHLDQVPLKHLRVGTIDNLITLSDNLGRIDAFGKSLIQKLFRTYSDIEDSDQELDVYNKSMHQFITSFEWDEGHMNPREKLPALVTNIHNVLQRTAEKLRKMTTTLQTVQSSVQVIERRKTASLMTKNLREFVDSRDWKNGDYIRSALIVVPINKQQDFVENYQFLEDSVSNEKLKVMQKKKYEKQLRNDYIAKYDQIKQKAQSNSDSNTNSNSNSNKEKKEKNSNAEENEKKERSEDGIVLVLSKEEKEIYEKEISEKVEQYTIDIMGSHQTRTVVPNSAVELVSDKECILYRVHLLRAGYEWFKLVSRECGYMVRDFTFDANGEIDEEKTMAELKKKANDEIRKLKIYCRSTFADVFKRFIHLKLIRVFVESVLRFGLPVDFSISVIQPTRGHETKLLKTLELRYMHLVDKALQAPGKDNEVDFSGVGGEFYPFVYVPLKIELVK